MSGEGETRVIQKIAPRQQSRFSKKPPPPPSPQSDTPPATALNAALARSTSNVSTAGSNISRYTDPLASEALKVRGMANSRVVGGGASASFRSKTSVGDSHIKALSSHTSTGVYRPRTAIAGGGATSSFRSTLGSDRDAHYRDLAKQTSSRTEAPATRPVSPNPAALKSATSSFFRSNTPVGCAHITSKCVDASYEVQHKWTGPKKYPTSFERSNTPVGCAHIPKQMPTDASYETRPRWGTSGGTAAFRSATSAGDAHIRAVTRPNVVTPTSYSQHGNPSGPKRVPQKSSFFMSKTSIGDAHIKAVTKPVDVVMTYSE